MDVVVDSPRDMNLLGLFLAAALDARRDALAGAGLEGAIAMTAGGMSVTLSFDRDAVTIRRGADADARAHVKGTLEGLVDIARGRMGRAVLARRAYVTGNPLAALPLAKVLRS